MAIVSDRRYPLEVDRARFWAAIERVEDYRRWWPWLRRFDGVSLGEGQAWRCTVAPPLPYVVRFVLRVVEVDAPRRVAVTVSGDIVGQASITVEESPTGCQVRLQSELSPDNILLRSVALAARPIAQFGHDWVLDNGARQFTKAALRAQ